MNLEYRIMTEGGKGEDTAQLRASLRFSMGLRLDEYDNT